MMYVGKQVCILFCLYYLKAVEYVFMKIERTYKCILISCQFFFCHIRYRNFSFSIIISDLNKLTVPYLNVGVHICVTAYSCFECGFQSVGINEKAARLNGINPTVVKLLSFVILGVCVAVASIVKISNLGTLTTKSLMDSIEMDAILAVAIGGNSLGGGKFRLSGTILGAYTIQTLTTTLNVLQVESESMKAYKAIVILVIMVAGSPVIKNWITSLKNRRQASEGAVQRKEAA